VRVEELDVRFEELDVRFEELDVSYVWNPFLDVSYVAAEGGASRKHFKLGETVADDQCARTPPPPPLYPDPANSLCPHDSPPSFRGLQRSCRASVPFYVVASDDRVFPCFVVPLSMLR